jgi:hypothetical protein
MLIYLVWQEMTLPPRLILAGGSRSCRAQPILPHAVRVYNRTLHAWMCEGRKGSRACRCLPLNATDTDAACSPGADKLCIDLENPLGAGATASSYHGEYSETVQRLLANIKRKTASVEDDAGIGFVGPARSAGPAPLEDIELTTFVANQERASLSDEEAAKQTHSAPAAASRDAPAAPSSSAAPPQYLHARAQPQQDPRDTKAQSPESGAGATKCPQASHQV